MSSRERRLAPAAITVIAAAAEQEENHKDNQQEFHNFLRNINYMTYTKYGFAITITLVSEYT
jgi:hypothetical protein